MGIDPNNHGLTQGISSLHGTNYSQLYVNSASRNYDEGSSSTTGPANQNLNLTMETASSPTDLGHHQ